MASKSPYFMTAVGEAGLVARKSAKERNKSDKADKIAELKLKTAEIKLKQAEAKVAAGDDYEWKSKIGKLHGDLEHALNSDRKAASNSIWKEIVQESVDDPESSPFTKISLDKITPESALIFTTTRNPTDIVWKDQSPEGTEKRRLEALGNIPVDKVTGKSIDQFLLTGKWADLEWKPDESGIKFDELDKKINTRNKFCKTDPDSQDCLSAQTNIDRYVSGTQRQQMSDDPMKMANDLRIERSTKQDPIKKDIAIADKALLMLGEDFSQFTSGEANAIPKMLDKLIDTDTHSYKSIEDLQALGGLVDQAHSVLQRMAGGTPDEDTWTEYHNIINKIQAISVRELGRSEEYYSSTAKFLLKNDPDLINLVFGRESKTISGTSNGVGWRIK